MSEILKNFNSPEYQPISKEKIVEIGLLIIEARKNNDIAKLNELQEILIKGNIKFIMWVKNRYRYHTLSDEDFFSAGLEGLTLAVKRWKPELGSSLLNYVERYIKTAMSGAIDNSRTIKIAQKVAYKTGKLNNEVYKKENELGRNLTNKEKNDMFGKDKKLMNLPHISNSLDNEFDYFSQNLHDEYNNPENIIEHNEMIDTVQDALSELSDIEQNIINSRFGLNDYDKKTLSELGDMYNMTGEAMRRIEHTALSKLRHPALKANIIISD